MNQKQATLSSHHPLRSNIRTYLLVFFLPVIAGLAISLVLPHYGIASKFGGTGHDGYLELARSLFKGDGFRFSSDGPAVFHRPPLYPLLLTPLMGLPETAIKVGVVLINSLFLMMAALYTRRICKLLLPQATTGTFAMALLVCNPWTLRLVSSPLSAIMQMALYSALCFYFLRFIDQFRQYGKLPTRQLAIRFLPVSLLTTAMCFSHGTSVYVCSAIFITSALVMLVNREWKLLGFLTLTAALTLTALSPWAMRNQEELNRIELSSSGAGFTYFLGNSYWGIDADNYREDLSVGLNAIRMGGVAEASDSMLSYWGITDTAVDNQLRDAMGAHIKENPAAIMRKSLLNLADIYFPLTHTLVCQSGRISSTYCPESLNTYQMANRAARSALMLLIIGLACYYLASNRTQKTLLPWVAAAGALLHTAPYLPIATYAHHGIYSLGALPLLCALAAAALYRLRIHKALHTPGNNPLKIWNKTPATIQTEKAREIQQQTTAALERKDREPGAVVDHIIS